MRYLAFRVNQDNTPTGELPDLVLSRESVPTGRVAVTAKPAEIVNQRQAFDTFVGLRVEQGEQVFYWRHPDLMELPQI